MRKLNILSLWVSLSGDESIAVYQDAVQKGKWTRFLERIHGKSPRSFFLFLDSCLNGLLKRACHQGGLLLGPS